MHELYSDIKQTLRERFSSPMWSTFIISWLVVNWKMPVAILFEDGQNILRAKNLLKIEYISKLYLIQIEWLPEWAEIILWRLLVPAIMVWIIYWLISMLDIWVFKKAMRVEDEKNKAKLEVEQNKRIVLEEERKNVEKKQEITKSEETLQEKQRKKEEEWEKEFEDFEKTKAYSYLSKVITWVLWYYGWLFSLIQDMDIIAYYTSHDILTTKETEDNQSLFSFTEKWNFFVKKFTSKQKSVAPWEAYVF